MLKKLARKILKDELQRNEELISQLKKSEQRLSDLANELSFKLSIERPIREYSFTPQTVTAEEQKIIGDFVETPIIELISKWFKSKADQNNDLLLHNSTSDPVKEAKYKLAVLIYDDWKIFIDNCQKASERQQKQEV